MDYPPDTFDLCVVVGCRGLSGLLSSHKDPKKMYDYSRGSAWLVSLTVCRVAARRINDCEETGN
jgi:hypothetical protein